jgi:hypothetical protein
MAMSFYEVTALDTEPINMMRVQSKGFQPLRKLVIALEQLPFEQLEAKGDELCMVQEAVYPPIARRMRRSLEIARVHGDYPVELVLAALSIGNLTAYALRPTTNTAYTLGTAWWHALGSIHDPTRSIKEGIFAIERTLFEENTPLREIAMRPILVREVEAHRLLQVAPASEAQLRRVSHEIVGAFQRENPGERQKMRRKDFEEMVMRRLPASIKASAQRAWKNYTPPSWKRRGRLAGSGRRR